MTPKTILYIEDNEVNRRIVQDLLRRTSYRLLEAPDGEAGLEMARRERPDLILMDIQLPKISGIEATRTLRREPATAAIPDHRHHVLRPGRRRAEGQGRRGHRLSGQAVQPARSARDDSQAGSGGRGRVMKPAALWLIAAALVLSPGCVKQPDWIESTLVTADVTGVWEGTVSGGASAVNMRVLLDLEQEGPKVKGELQMGFAQGQNSGPLEGRVGGDVFHFRVIAGHGRDNARRDDS